MSIIKRLAWVARTYSSHRWYGVWAGGLLSLDYFIPILPSTTLVIASSLLQPAKWFSLGIFTAAGSTFGAVAVSYLVQMVGDGAINTLLTGATATEGWAGTVTFIRAYGTYGLFLMACLPIPIRTVTIVTAISGVGLPQVALAVGLGRVISYVGISFLASRFPHWVLRFSFVRRSPLVNRLGDEPK